MLSWLKKWGKESHTKYFLLNWIIYGILIVASTIYVYVKVDDAHRNSKKIIHTKIKVINHE